MHSVIHRVVAGWAMLGLILLAACGGDSAGPSEGGSGGAVLSGTIRDQNSLSGLAGVKVTIGLKSTTSNAAGHFELTNLPVGTANVRADLLGYESVLATITLIGGNNNHDFGLLQQEIYRLGVDAVFVPRGAGTLRGALIILGGPVTSGFITGDSLTPGSNDPALEESLQSLGSSLRALARSARVALLGTRTVGLTDSPATDAALLATLATVATSSGHPELADAPLLMFGLSAGAPEAAGMAARLPGRTIGLLVRVPKSVTALSSPATLGIPAFVMQAQLDVAVNNPSVQAVFATNRSQGGLWSLAVEPGVGHSDATSTGNGAAVSWLADVLTLRLPAVAGNPLVSLAESSGWLGNQSTHEVAAWADYPADRTQASWLLSEGSASLWQTLATPPDTSGGGGN